MVRAPPPPAFLFAGEQSRGSLCYSIVFHQPALFSLHTASTPETKYIYHLAVLHTSSAGSLGFHYWAECSRSHRGRWGLGMVGEEEGEEGREQKESKQFFFPASPCCKTNGDKRKRCANQYTSPLIKQAGETKWPLMLCGLWPSAIFLL